MGANRSRWVPGVRLRPLHGIRAPGAARPNLQSALGRLHVPAAYNPRHVEDDS